MSLDRQEVILAYTSPVVIDAYSGIGCFRDPARCVYCQRLLHKVVVNQANISLQINEVAECSCGWWYALVDNDVCNDGHVAAIGGVLDHYNVDSKQVPVEVLEHELRKRPHLFRHVNPTKMEKLVGSILRDVFDCDVVHLGGAGDGGIDLLLLHADDPIAVQVKRRQSASSAEGVAPIRELLGAALLGRYKHALFVTTAPRFSPAAKDAARLATEIDLVSSFELCDLDKLTYFVREQQCIKSWELALDASRPQDWRSSGGIVREARQGDWKSDLRFEDVLSR